MPHVIFVSVCGAVWEVRRGRREEGGRRGEGGEEEGSIV